MFITIPRTRYGNFKLTPVISAANKKYVRLTTIKSNTAKEKLWKVAARELMNGKQLFVKLK